MFGFLRQLLDLIYKKRCYVCGNSKDNTEMCQNCLKKIKFLPKKPVKSLNNVEIYSMTIYTGIIMKMIRGLKYHRQKGLAYFQAKLMYDYWKTLETSKEDFVILPVPMHKKRESNRGYNHMLLIAKEFGKLTGYEVNGDFVKRVKNTKPQYSLTKKERESNLSGAFEIDKRSPKPANDKKILILDDIVTTGSTISELVSTLRTENYNVVKALTTSCSEFNIV